MTATRRPACPECGGKKQTVLSGGWANDDDLPFSYLSCDNCHYHGIQMLFWLPPEASISALDEHRRLMMRLSARRRRGHYPQLKKFSDHRGRRISSDRVEITVKIIPGRLQRGLRKRIAAMRGNSRRSPVVREVVA